MDGQDRKCDQIRQNFDTLADFCVQFLVTVYIGNGQNVGATL